MHILANYSAFLPMAEKDFLSWSFVFSDSLCLKSLSHSLLNWNKDLAVYFSLFPWLEFSKSSITF